MRSRQEFDEVQVRCRISFCKPLCRSIWHFANTVRYLYIPYFRYCDEVYATGGISFPWEQPSTKEDIASVATTWPADHLFSYICVRVRGYVYRELGGQPVYWSICTQWMVSDVRRQSWRYHRLPTTPTCQPFYKLIYTCVRVRVYI